MDNKRFGLDEWLCALLLALMTAIAFINVLGRYLFGYSLAFTEELTVNFFVYVVVLGTGIGFERLIHPRFVTVVDALPRSWRPALIVLSYALTVALFGALVWATLRSIYVNVTLFQAQSQALGIPTWMYDAPVLFCVLLVLWRLWRGLRVELRQHRLGSEPTQG